MQNERREASSIRIWRASKSYVAAFLIFITSRLILILAIVFAAKFIPENPIAGTWNANSSWYHYLLRYDTGWYVRIVTRGYSYDGNDLVPQPVAFFPLYPLISRIPGFLFGINEYASLLIVSNLAILIAIPLFFKLIEEDYGKRVAFYTVALISFFPTSLFFSAGYTESLAFLLIVSFFLLLKREHYLLAASCAGLATATRSTAIVLLAPLAWEIWLRFFKTPKRLAVYAVSCLAIATSGLWFYMSYLWAAFNHPLAFMTNERAWHPGSAGVGGKLFQVLTLQPFYALTDIFQAGPTPTALEPWFFLLALFLLIFFRKMLSTPYFLFALGLLLLPYFTLSGVWGFQSFTRYVLPAFPVFIIMGNLCKGRPWLAVSIAGVLSALLFMYSAMFAQWYWVV
jgi:hypothetical protein